MALKDLIEAGTITPVIDETYPLRDTAAAMAHIAAGHASGKTLIAVAAAGDGGTGQDQAQTRSFFPWVYVRSAWGRGLEPPRDNLPLGPQPRSTGLRRTSPGHLGARRDAVRTFAATDENPSSAAGVPHEVPNQSRKEGAGISTSPLSAAFGLGYGM